MIGPNKKNTSASESPRPYWIPAGVDFNQLPEELRAGIVEIVNPAYKELVLAAKDGLEKATGVTIVSLLWMELLEQIRMNQDLADPHSVLAPPEDHRDSIGRYLRLVGAKVNASRFLLRLHEFTERWGHHTGFKWNWDDPFEPLGDLPTDTNTEESRDLGET